MRGKVFNGEGVMLATRITPAYAGKSTRNIQICCRVRDHPRVCGEKLEVWPYLYVVLGSPPRMRGKVPSGRSCTPKPGITPAYAGKRRSYPPAAPADRDHPRVCGEKRLRTSFCFSDAGSPPRMRGKGGLILLLRQLIGITPAYAGKSGCGLLSVFQTQDHPRVCGEKPCRCRYPVQPSGSPPRMRGKAASEGVTRNGSGITPAYAGKSAMFQRSGAVSRDHPRVCGEKGHNIVCRFGGIGSPPRMRGKDLLGGFRAAQHRITPAYAGKRLKRSHSIGHFSCILCLFHSVLHRASVSGGSRAGPCAPPCLPAQNAIPV